MTAYSYTTYDVFTRERFAGNPLAIVFNADGLSDAAMQALAAEFGYPETTFVLPPRSGDATHRVRIFTPVQELPFAGHPNIGTALALAAQEGRDLPADFVFEELAGLVRVRVAQTPEGPIASLTAPAPFERQKEIDAHQAADLISLSAEHLQAEFFTPTIATTGAPFLFLPLRSATALAQARANLTAFERFNEAIGAYLFTTDAPPGFEVDARMFAPGASVPEDPATGGAAVTLAGLLALQESDEGAFAYRIRQGAKMGRPSDLQVSAERAGETVLSCQLAGAAVQVFQGHFSAG